MEPVITPSDEKERASNNNTNFDSEDDYGSVRHVQNRTKNEGAGLLDELQQRMKIAEKNKATLEIIRIEELERESLTADVGRAQDMIRLQELEMENAKIKDDLKSLRRQLAAENEAQLRCSQNLLMGQFNAMSDELDRHRVECIHLRKLLANRNTSVSGQLNEQTTLSASGLNGGELFIEDKDILMAFETQNRIIRHLENELQEEKASSQRKIQKEREEVERLRLDNDRQQKVLAGALHGTPQDQTEAGMQHEIARLSTDILGMIEFNMSDVKKIVRNLVCELKPRVALTLLPPGLPAYIIFMCARHADYINSDEKIRSIIRNSINAILWLCREREDFDTLLFLLVNTCRLHHNITQYRREESAQENTPEQNDQCLRHFDLSKYRPILSDTAKWIYQTVFKHMKDRVQELIVPAILEHEAISGPVVQGGRARSGSMRYATSSVHPQEAIALLLRELTMFHQALQQYGVDPPLVAQAFRQVFYYIGACALNSLLERKEMCNRSKGIQIRYNISHLEQWVRDQHIHGQDTSTSITDTLQPIIQAAQLLQARKSNDDVANICAMCSRLTSAQIKQIVYLYKPDELEDRVPMTFICKVQEELQKRTDPQSQRKLLMDIDLLLSVSFQLNPSSIKLQDITVPTILNLPMLKKV